MSVVRRRSASPSGPRTRVVTGELGESRWVLARRTPMAALRPYVLRIDGYEDGLARTRGRAAPARAPRDPSSVDPSVRQKNAPVLTPVIPLTLEEVDRAWKAAAER